MTLGAYALQVGTRRERTFGRSDPTGCHSEGDLIRHRSSTRTCRRRHRQPPPLRPSRLRPWLSMTTSSLPLPMPRPPRHRNPRSNPRLSPPAPASTSSRRRQPHSNLRRNPLWPLCPSEHIWTRPSSRCCSEVTRDRAPTNCCRLSGARAVRDAGAGEEEARKPCGMVGQFPAGQQGFRCQTRTVRPVDLVCF